jgi:hypothetical protein
MTIYRTLRTLPFVFVILVIFSCKDEKQDPSRSFYMGFTPFPYDVSLAAVEETYTNINSNSDIINHHFDNGVPWPEALNGEQFSENIMGDWTFRRNETPASAKVIVSVAALNGNRDGMAKYRGTADDMDLPSPWDTYTFSDAEVKTAYVNYCKRLIDFFEPDYFNMNVEANLLHSFKPTLWSDFLQFHEYVYTNLKSSYPNLTIFTSIAGAQLLDGYIDNNDVSLQRLAALQLLSHSDIYGISFYPYMSAFLGNPYPENSFQQLFSISEKPVAIAETGYPAQSFWIDVENNKVQIESNETKQRDYYTDLLEACNERDAVFVIQFTIRDYDQLWEYLGSKEDITIAWRDTGLIGEDGRERPAFAIWKEHFDRNRR